MFSFTDDWHRGGEQVADWQMGLTTAARERKTLVRRCQNRFQQARPSSRSPKPKVSVVVASYSSAPRSEVCLESLRNLNYSDYEVILVDDGSTDATPATQFSRTSATSHHQNLGLSRLQHWYQRRRRENRGVHGCRLPRR